MTWDALLSSNYFPYSPMASHAGFLMSWASCCSGCQGFDTCCSGCLGSDSMLLTSRTLDPANHSGPCHGRGGIFRNSGQFGMLGYHEWPFWNVKISRVASISPSSRTLFSPLPGIHGGTGSAHHPGSLGASLPYPLIGSQPTSASDWLRAAGTCSHWSQPGDQSSSSPDYVPTPTCTQK